MIGKNEHEDESNNSERINLMSEQRKTLEDNAEKVKEEVRLCFEQLAKVLKTREKQLLRQIEAIRNQRLSIVQSNQEIPFAVTPVRINLTEQRDLEERILKFGELSSSERNSIDVRDAEPYKIEDYVEANRDHVTFEKYIAPARDSKKIVRETVFDDFINTSCDLSFNTSSEADTSSENEITVLMNHNYYEFSDGLPENNCLSPKSSPAETNHGCPNEEDIRKDKLFENSQTWELNVTAQTINENITEKCAVPETTENIFSVKNTIGSNKENYETSSVDLDKNVRCSTDSESPLENMEGNGDVSLMRNKTRDSEEHPKQIQQWLQQILVETETEPAIHEIEQFAEISKSRFKEFQFPLET